MALSCIIFEIKRDIGRKSRCFHTPAFNAPLGVPSNIVIPFGIEKVDGVATRRWKKWICLAVSIE